MYKVTKRIEISSSHHLNLPYSSKCRNVHGHNWIIEVEVSSEGLDKTGMVVDFIGIKEVVKKFDHRDLNVLFNKENPTAENIAKCIEELINAMLKEEYDTAHQREMGHNRKVWVSKVTVQESEGNTVCYIP